MYKCFQMILLIIDELSMFVFNMMYVFAYIACSYAFILSYIFQAVSKAVFIAERLR